MQKTQTTKKTKESKNSKLDIINIFVLILPVILSIAGMDMCYYCEGVYASILIVGMIVLTLKILTVAKFSNNIVITAIIASCLLIMSGSSLMAGEEEIAPYIFISTLYVFSCELYNLIKIFIKKYHTTQSYKMKCYKKINLLNEYREKGVITEEEYQETRKQIISKIR